MVKIMINAIKTDWEQKKLKGKVQLITETKYGAIELFGEIKKVQFYSKNSLKFDSEGNNTEVAELWKDGSLESNTTYKYNADEKLTKMASYGDGLFLKPEKEGSLVGKTFFSYDSQRSLVEESEYGPDGVLLRKETSKYNSEKKEIEKVFYCQMYGESKCLSKYDFKGNRTEKTYYSKDGLKGSKTIYTYDSNSNLLVKISHSNEGLLEIKRTFKYDSQGNIIEKGLFEATNYYEGIYYLTIFKYDSHGNEIRVINYEFDEIRWKQPYGIDYEENYIESQIFHGYALSQMETVTQYDLNGYKTEEAFYNGVANLRSLDFKLRFKYDSAENLIEETKYISGSLQEKTEYYTDKNGNWIKKIEFDHIETPKFITERKIKYYQ
jgi:hypothetical protein